MAIRVNTFAGGTPSDTITNANSGGSSGDPFDEADTPQDTTDGTCTYGTTHGVACMSFSLGATSGPERRGWVVNAGASAATQFYRLYLDPADVTGVIFPLRGMNDTSSAQRFRVNLTSAGVVTFRDNANTTIWTSTALTSGTLWRIECAVGGSTSAAGRIWVYSGDSTIAAQDSGDLTGVNFGGPIQSVWWGHGASSANVAGKITKVGWSDTAPLGPATTTPIPLIAHQASLPWAAAWQTALR